MGKSEHCLTMMSHRLPFITKTTYLPSLPSSRLRRQVQQSTMSTRCANKELMSCARLIVPEGLSQYFRVTRSSLKQNVAIFAPILSFITHPPFSHRTQCLRKNSAGFGACLTVKKKHSLLMLVSSGTWPNWRRRSSRKEKIYVHSTTRR